MTTTSGGNISIRDENGNIWITPSGVDKGSLTATDIVCLGLCDACRTARTVER
jgi:L-fuculose-phosphate aldolase